jgi:hypothetical protein
MKLRARVKRIAGLTKHYEGRIEGGHVVKEAELPAPVSVGIEETEGGFLLLYFDSDGNCITDTWHRTVEDAKSHAKDEFDIDESDWIDVALV